MIETFVLHVNGTRYTIQASPMDRLLGVLRDQLKLTGTKEGCGEGECGACTVLVDGLGVTACLVPICQVAGRPDSASLGKGDSLAKEITTIEATGHEEIQEAFLEHGGTQCGMCTPGMIIQSRAAFEHWNHSAPTADDVRRALAGNLCRCTGYGKIVDSVLAAWRPKA